MANLYKFKGRALFFFRLFFVDTLLPLVNQVKPGDGDQMTRLINEQYSQAFEKCRARARDYVQLFMKKADDKIKRIIEVSLSTSAGTLNREKFDDVEKQVGQLLAFISQRTKDNFYCQISEPWIVDALMDYFKQHKTQNPDDDVVFQVFIKLFHFYGFMLTLL